MDAFQELIARDEWGVSGEKCSFLNCETFWNSLDKCKVENGILDFGLDDPINVHGGRVIVARDCYFKLWDIMNKPGASKNILITGTLGVGKRHFLKFVVWRCKIEGKSCLHISRSRHHLCHKDKVYTWAGNLSTCGVLSCPDLWMISDEKPLLCNARCLMVTSPNLVESAEFEKRKPISKYYMPPWTLEECALKFEIRMKGNLQSSERCSKEEFIKRFELCGGVPRNIFAYNHGHGFDPSSYTCSLYEDFYYLLYDVYELEKVSPKTFEYFFLINVNTEDIVVDHLGRKIPLDPNSSEFDPTCMKIEKAFQQAKVSFCKKNSSKEMFSLIKKRYSRAYRHLTNIFKKDPYAYLSSPLGGIFEEAAIHTIAEGGTLCWRKNGDENVRQWTFGQHEVKEFNDFEEICGDGLYYSDSIPFGAILVTLGKVLGLYLKLEVYPPTALLSAKNFEKLFPNFLFIFVLPEVLFDQTPRVIVKSDFDIYILKMSDYKIEKNE